MQTTRPLVGPTPCASLFADLIARKILHGFVHGRTEKRAVTRPEPVARSSTCRHPTLLAWKAWQDIQLSMGGVRTCHVKVTRDAGWPGAIEGDARAIPIKNRMAGDGLRRLTVGASAGRAIAGRGTREWMCLPPVQARARPCLEGVHQGLAGRAVRRQPSPAAMAHEHALPRWGGGGKGAVGCSRGRSCVFVDF
eukprot:366256-Chlamydomonas_euryale.AAC.27